MTVTAPAAFNEGLTRREAAGRPRSRRRRRPTTVSSGRLCSERIPLDVDADCGERVEVMIGAPAQEDAQVRFSVQPRLAAIAAQIGGHRRTKHELTIKGATPASGQEGSRSVGPTVSWELNRSRAAYTQRRTASAGRRTTCPLTSPRGWPTSVSDDRTVPGRGDAARRADGQQALHRGPRRYASRLADNAARHGGGSLRP